MDDAGGAEDRQAALDAEPRVPGLVGQRLAAGNGDLDLDIARGVMRAGEVFHHRSHHLPRHRVDRRLARLHRQPRPGDRAHPLARLETDAGPRAGQPDASDDHRRHA